MGSSADDWPRMPLSLIFGTVRVDIVFDVLAVGN